MIKLGTVILSELCLIAMVVAKKQNHLQFFLMHLKIPYPAPHSP